MKVKLTVLLVLMLTMQTMPNHNLDFKDAPANYSAAKSTGVDLSVEELSYSYPNSADSEKYRMFSSNYPILNFNRPADLYVVDAVRDVEIQLRVKVANLGNTNSPVVDLNVLILHNEYQDYEIYNSTNQINVIRGQSSEITLFRLTPTYSGNHSIIITPTMSLVDDKPSNDVLSTTFTVASYYFNCDDLNTWTVGQGWGTNSDTFLSQGSSCHAGNGQASTYLPNIATELLTPVLDMSDAVTNPTRTNGVSFYFTGSIAPNDFVRLYSKDSTNVWDELASISGTIDNDLADGANWQTWSESFAGHTSPLIPMPQQNFHANSQFKFRFTSDASNNDIGFWMDDIVIMYDQTLDEREYSLSATGMSVVGAVPNSWGKALISLTNTGNVSETFTPALSGLPNDWQHYFSHTTGVSITESNGIFLHKGESKVIELNYRPKSGENQGLFPVLFSAASKNHQSVVTELSMQLEVVPDRIPEFTPPLDVIRCSPGNSCVTSISLTNIGGATDVFSLSLDYTDLPIGWSVSFAWNQQSNVLVQPGFNVPIMLTYTVGSDAVPDSVGYFDLIAVSENDSSRTDVITIEIVASMVSDAHIASLNENDEQKLSIIPGETVVVDFSVTNNASVQDIFQTNMVFDSANDWTINDIFPERLFLNSGDTGTFSASITAPHTAQVGDDCPGYLASVVSQRSGEIFLTNLIDNMVISQVNNVQINLLNSPSSLIPGEVNTFTIQLSNLGNGQVPTEISLDGLPNYWPVTFVYGGNVVDNRVQLGELSDLSATKVYDVNIHIPAGLDYGLMYDISINVQPLMFGSDVDLSDNSASITLLTEMVRNIELSADSQSINAGVGNLTTLYLDINNMGNVDESDLRIFANMYSDSYNGILTGYMSIGNNGIAYDFNQYHPFTIGKNSSRQIKLDVVIPQDIGIDSTINFDLSLSSASNEFETMTHSAVMVVDYVREISLKLNNPANRQSNDFDVMWINISTISTLDEVHNILFETPTDWKLICDSNVIGQEGIVREDNILSSIERDQSIYCEVINEGKTLDGEVVVTLLDLELNQVEQKSLNFQFTKQTDDSAAFSPQVIGGIAIGGLILIIAVCFTVLRVMRRGDIIDLESSSKPINGPPISGPPISSQQHTPETSADNSDGTNPPPIPSEGLPQGWTIEQWNYYGQQYLDMNNRG